MAIIKSAKKAHRQAQRRRVVNLRRTRAMKDAVSDFRKLIAGQKGAEAGASLPTLYQAIDKAVKGGMIKANTAARMKSRLTKKVSAK